MFTTLLYKSPKYTLFFTILFMAILSTLYNAFLPLHGDEAYYWVWGQNLQMGYYDHPPMIAIFMYLSSFISDSEWAVRMVNVFSFSITALYIFKITEKAVDEKTALNAVFIFFSVIMVHAGYIITTPDSPINMFWAISMYYSYMAIFEGKWKDYIFAGLSIGCMMLSKYTAILFIASVFIFLLIKRRDIFFNIKFYVTLLISLLVVSPLLIWNYQNDWISFTFQLHHGSTDTFSINFGDFIGFILGQFLLFSPVFTWVLFYYMYKEKLSYTNDKIFFIVLTVFVTLSFFTYKGLFKSMGLNYAAPAYIGGGIYVSYILSKYKLSKTFKWGLIIALALTMLGRYLFLFHLDLVQDRMYQTDKTVERFMTFKHEGDALYGDHLTTAALITFYAPGHPKADVGVPSRFSQYDLWRGDEHLKNGIILSQEKNLKSYLLTKYKDVKLIDTDIVVPHKRIFYTYRVTNPKKIEKK